MKCPTHEKQEMVCELTQHGLRYTCRVEGCTMVCWNGATSTPADAETRALRHECHLIFDPMWYHRRQFKTRRQAYRWLRETLKLPASLSHIGMLNREQCLFLLKELKKLER